MKAGRRGRKWIVATHIFFAGTWTGAAVCLMLIQFLSRVPGNGSELYAVNSAAKIIDDFVIIPSALGTLITGLLISLLMDWGFFRHAWVGYKWVVTVTAVLFGTFFLGPWLNEMTALSDSLRFEALQNAAYLHNRLMNHVFGTLQASVLVFTVFVSVFRPWGRKSGLQEASPQD